MEEEEEEEIINNNKGIPVAALVGVLAVVEVWVLLLQRMGRIITRVEEIMMMMMMMIIVE